MKKGSIGLVCVCLFLLTVSLFGGTIDVNRYDYATGNNAYDRNPSIIYDGSSYWLFYTKGDNVSTSGVRGPGYNPDSDTYVVYYKNTAAIEGLAGASETKLELSETNRPASFDQRVVSACYFDDHLYAFVSSGQSGGDRGLYYYEYSGGAWSGPVTLMADATARGGHVNVTTDGSRVYIVWESSDGSSDCYTWDGLTLSSKIDISDGNQPKITYYALLRSGNLFVVNIEDGTGDIEVYFALTSPAPLFSHHSTALAGAGLYDPCIFNDGSNLYVISAPYVAVDRQYLVQAKFDVSISTWSEARIVSYGGYGGVEWWDYWPCGYYDGSDLWLFFTTETDVTSFGDGEIVFAKMDWDLTNEHYFFIQNAVDQAEAGDDIDIAPGTYEEQVVITTSALALTGAGNGSDPAIHTIVKSPESLAYYFITGSNNYPVIGIDGVAGVSVSDLLIDGDKQGDNNYRFCGLTFFNGGGTVTDVDVINIMNSTLSGAQHGVAVYSYNNTGGPYSITLTDMVIEDFQKNAVALLGTGLTVDIDNVTTIGYGSTDITAQNGIQIGGGVGGSIDNCQISDVDYMGDDWTASGLLNYGDIAASGINISGCQTSIYWTDGSGTLVNSSVTSPTGDGFYAYNSTTTLLSNPRLPASPIDYYRHEGAAQTVMNVSVSYCDFIGSDIEYSWGVAAFSTSPDPVNLTVSNCKMSNWDYGIYAYDYGGAVELVAADNSLINCTYAFGSNTTNIQNASGNWYGTTSPVEVAALVEGLIDYTPWLGGGTETNPGFEGDFSELWVDESSYQTGSAGYIEEGIEAVTASTVHIAPGNYSESIIIGSSFNKHGLILSGDDTAMPVIENGVRFLQTAAINGITFEYLYIKGIAGGGNMIFDMDNSGAVNDFVMSGCVIDGENIGGRAAFGGQNLGQSFTMTGNEFKDILGWAVMDIESGSGDGSCNLPFTTVTFAENNIHDCNGSVALRGRPNPDRTPTVNVYGNTIANIGGNEGYTGEQWAAIEINHAAAANIYENDIDDVVLGEWGEGQGMQLWDIGALDMHDNSITNCYQGLFVFGGSSGGPYGGPYAIPGGAVYHNTFSGNDQYNLSVDPGCTGSALNAIQNYWGSINCLEITGTLQGNINFDPWCNADFSRCDFTCNLAEAWVDDDWTGPANCGGHVWQYDAFDIIQDAVNAVISGGIVHIAAGSYEEQVVITKANLQLLGAGSGADPAANTVVKSPVTLAYSFITGTNNNYPIIGIDGATGINIDNMRIDGLGRGNNNYRFIGISFWNAGGNITDCYITNITDTPFTGAQHGNGIYAYNNTGGPYTISITGTEIDNFQKNGMTLSGDGLTVNLSGCTVSGIGATDVTAQNGIQISYGAGGTVNNCSVSGIAYTGTGWVASGMLFYDGTTINIGGTSTVANSQASVIYQETNGSVDGLTVTAAGVEDEEGISIRDYGSTVINIENLSFNQVSPVMEEWDNQSTRVNPTTVDISNAVFTGSHGISSYGIAAWSLGDNVNVSLEDCEITDWEIGVVAYESGSTVNLNAYHNAIAFNDFGFWTNAAAPQMAQYNWWGAYCGPYHETLNLNGEGNEVSDNVDFAHWCNETYTKCDFDEIIPVTVWINDDYAPGLLNDGHYWCYDAFDQIQKGVNAVADNGVVQVAAGTYAEQVVINKNIALEGTGDPVIEPPAARSLQAFTIEESGRTFYPMVLAYGGTDDGSGNISGAGTISVTITGIDVDGNNSATASTFVGIMLRNCQTSTVSHNDLYELLFSSGNPETGGIMIYGNSSVQASYNTVNDWTRVGILAIGDDGPLTDPAAEVSNNTVVGEGPLPSGSWAQNGIQFGYGATGSVISNEVSDIAYIPTSWAASGITIFYAGSGLTVTGNNIHDCEAAIYPNYTDNLTIDGNTLNQNEFSFILGGDNIVVTENIFTGNGQALYIGDATNVAVTDNSFSGNDYAIIADGVAANLVFTGNSINTSTTCGIYLDEYYGSPTGVAVNFNDISGNAFGFHNNTAVLADAEANWWGDASGPAESSVALNAPDNFHPAEALPFERSAENEETIARTVRAIDGKKHHNADDPLRSDGTGNAVTALVDYSPWWGNNYIHDDHASPWNWYLNTSNGSTIQEGIDYTLAGDTVFATADTYSGPGNKQIDFGGKEIVLTSSDGIDNTVIDCEFSGRAFYFHNGETGNAVVKGFTVKNGSVTDNGGAFHCVMGSSPAIMACLIINNQAGCGGGISIDGADPRIINCTISGNSAFGAGIGSKGGGIYCDNTASEIKNVILWSNTATGDGDQIFGTLPLVTYCDVEGGYPGATNIDDDPLFRDQLNDDFHLMSTACGHSYDSPCIDAGYPNISDEALDCAYGLGGSRSDMGAYGGVIIVEGLSYLPGDANMYNAQWQPEVIGADVTYLVNYFRSIETSVPCFLSGFWCSADANGDCQVIGSDVTRLVNYFRGSGGISFCPDHPPAWLTPDDLPVDMPAGWPNCEVPISSRTISTRSND